MDHQPYITGTKPADPGPLSRFTPPLEEGTISHWLSLNVTAGSWLLDPFGFSPRLILEAARTGYQVLVTINNPITRFLLEMSASPPTEADFKAALADLAVLKKGDERLASHLQSLYLTTCNNCDNEIQAESFLWRRDEDAPYARVYTCPHCEDAGERVSTQQDIDRAQTIKATDALHRSRAFERVVALDDEDRVYAEEAISHYLPRPLYFLTTIINRLDGLSMSPERKRALYAMILLACDAGNTLWAVPSERPRPKQLHIPAQFREHNLWMMLERGLSVWTETGSSIQIEAWPNKISESGGICIYEGRLSDLVHEVQKEIPIKAVIGSIPRPNQAFWTLSALWSGWLWGREAVEPFKIALRRRRYDWAWNATALYSAFSHLYEVLAPNTIFFGLLAEPEPSFLTSALTAADSAGFELMSLSMRTEHDPIQLTWKRSNKLEAIEKDADIETTREAMHTHLVDRGEPASYLHIHAAGLVSLAETRSLKRNQVEFDEALRATNLLLQNAVAEDDRHVHYSGGESIDTGLWGLNENQGPMRHNDSLSDKIEVALVTFLQKNPNSIYLEIENDLYPRFPGLLTPSKAMIYAVLNSYAERNGGAWTLRAEDAANSRRAELETITALLEAIGKRLDCSTIKDGKNYLWFTNDEGDSKTGPDQQTSFLDNIQGGTGGLMYTFYILASALVGRAMNETPHAPEKSIIIIPGGRASLVAYKTQRDPSLAARMKQYRLVKYRLLRTLLEVPVLTRETFEEQIAGDPLEKSKSQLMMF